MVRQSEADSEITRLPKPLFDQDRPARPTTTVQPGKFSSIQQQRLTAQVISIQQQPLTAEGISSKVLVPCYSDRRHARRRHGCACSSLSFWSSQKWSAAAALFSLAPAFQLRSPGRWLFPSRLGTGTTRAARARRGWRPIRALTSHFNKSMHCRRLGESTTPPSRSPSHVWTASHSLAMPWPSRPTSSPHVRLKR